MINKFLIKKVLCINALPPHVAAHRPTRRTRIKRSCGLDFWRFDPTIHPLQNVSVLRYESTHWQHLIFPK